MNHADTQESPEPENTEQEIEQELEPTYSPAALAMGITFMLWGILTHWSMSLIGVAVIVGALWSWMNEIRSSWSETH
ncbi:MAG: hypothetical protein K0U86_00340 [Planctomycetes bacterium]|nr:hypothetical protein [Planctomycetota bacterium]MCH9723334.1 hypothetical protein [Planctomycetota bacterium]MCH9779091.1 hypothetical protein [Planctomycetota bacterium]MCH9789704.1 hypothetical protein [Planctomycetota bacterium]MDF1742251.1 hypothetical protein [Gimesia sp.]